MRWLPLTLLGCGAMESPLSIVDDLRVLAMVVEPAAPAPLEPYTIEPIVLDATDAGFDTWSWWCIADQCGEGPLPPLPEGFPFPAELSTFACAPSGCEAPGDPADPASWLADRPFETTSLTTQALPQSPSPDQRVNLNPVLGLVGPTEGQPGETLVFTATIGDDDADDPRLAGYATAGTFPEQAVPAEAGQVEVSWVAPEAPGSFELVWVLTDGLGGVASTRTSVTIGAP